MKKSLVPLIGSAFLLTFALPLYAQIGCADSPENPTVVLALVGSAGALLASVRSRMKARRGSGQK